MDLSKFTFLVESQEEVLKELKGRKKAWLDEGSVTAASLLRRIAINADLKGLTAEVFDERVPNKRFNLVFRLSRTIDRMDVLNADAGVDIKGDLMFTLLKNGDVAVVNFITKGDEQTTHGHMHFDPSETFVDDYEEIVEGAVSALITEITNKIIKG